MKLDVLVLAVLLSFATCSIVDGPETPRMSVDPSAVLTGCSVRIQGSGFPGSTGFWLYLDGEEVADGTTYSGGSFYRTITLPRIISLGPHNLSVVCGQEFAWVEITVIQWSPNISVSPSRARPGEEVTVFGVGFPPNAYYEVYLAEKEIMGGATDDEGSFSRAYTLPKNMTLGIHEVTARATKYTGPPSAGTNLNISEWMPLIGLVPPEPNPGRLIVIEGSQFPPDAVYKVYLDGTEILVGTADGLGCFSRNYVLAPSLPLGEHILSAEAVEYGGPAAISRTISIVQWAARLRSEPPNPHPGSLVTLTGEDFPPETPFSLRFDGKPIASGNTSRAGIFTVDYLLPSNITIGLHDATAVAAGYAGPPSSSTKLNVTQWPLNLFIFPSDAHPGGRINLTGKDFPPAASYEIELDSLQIVSGTTNGSGSFKVTYLLPRTISLGQHTLTCVAHGFSGPPTSTHTFEISNWPVKVDVLPQRPHPGGDIQVTGSGYPPGSMCFVIMDGSQILEALVDRWGSFEESHTLPRNFSVGGHNLTVKGSFSGLTPVSVALDVEQWPTRVSVDPVSGSPGTLINVLGIGYPPGVIIGIYWDDSYVKATQSSLDGEFSVWLLAVGPQDYSYHILKVDATGGFSGPPSSLAYFWLGDVGAPEPTLLICDDVGRTRSSFFVGETISVTGTGFPGSVDMNVFLVPTGVPITAEDAAAWAQVTTDSNGAIQLTAIRSMENALALRAWLDVNGNLLLDGNDLVGQEFNVVPRPDLAIEDATLSRTSPVQGEPVDIETRLRNDGQTSQVGLVRAIYRGVQVASKVSRPLEPGEEEIVQLEWDTSAIPAGSGSLVVEAEPLPGEENLGNNDWIVGDVSIQPRPDVCVTGLFPDSREVHLGKILKVHVRVSNVGASPESFGLSLRWGTNEVAHLETELAAGEQRWLAIDWETSGTSTGVKPISAQAEVLLYERTPENNLLANGSVEITTPNHPPEADASGPYKGRTNATMTFDGSWSFDMDGEIASYVWSFGDGSSASGRIVNHTYVEEGRYEVTLTITDDDGDSSSARTEAVVEASPPIFLLSLVVLDGVRLTPVRRARVRIGTNEYVPHEFPLEVRLEEGVWVVEASAPGYRPVVERLALERSSSLSLTMMPIFSFFSCEASGKSKRDFSSNEIVYMSIESPGQYAALLYVVPDGSANNGTPLVDVTGEGQKYVLTRNGSSVVPVWKTRPIRGTYDIVLDLNLNGVLDGGDILYAADGGAFAIPQPGVAFALLLLLGPLVRRRLVS